MKTDKLPTARQLALNILQSVELQKKYTNQLLADIYRKYPLSPQEKALLKEMAGGVLRYRSRLDWALNEMTEHRLHKTHPLIRNIMRLGAYQLLYLGGVTPYAAVNESVELAHLYGHKGSAALVNGVLRNLSRQKETLRFPGLDKGPVTFFSVNYSHPEWIIQRWLKNWGAKQTTAICEANNKHSSISLRVNTLIASSEDCLKMLERDGITAAPHPYVRDCLNVQKGVDLIQSQAYRRGWVEIQSPLSQLIGLALDPKPGGKVLDLCAGRGVKTTHLAQIMKNDGQIFAAELYPKKLEQLKSNCARMGIKIIKPVAMDSAKALKDSVKFDRILLDAPCSGLGVLGRYPEARWQKSPQLIAQMRDLQRTLLRQAAFYLSSGGVLLYSTCSLEPEETDIIIEEFLSEYPKWRLEPIDAANISGKLWKSWPGLLPEDGFFMAKLVKED